MQKATSIFSPANSNLDITCKYFSNDFNFDLCHDFSFWKGETGRCIPKEMSDDENFVYYSFPPLCNRTEFDCMDSFFTQYCPNRDKDGERCDYYEENYQKQYFFCNESKTCIANGKYTVWR